MNAKTLAYIKKCVQLFRYFLALMYTPFQLLLSPHAYSNKILLIFLVT